MPPFVNSERQSARMSKITNDGVFNPVRHRMLYSCAMATVGVKGLKLIEVDIQSSDLICCFRCFHVADVLNADVCSDLPVPARRA